MLSLLFTGCSKKSSGGKPSDTYKEYVTALSNGKADDALPLLDITSRDALEKAGSAKIMDQIVKDIKGHQGIKSFTTLEEKINGDSATSKDTVVYTDGFTATKEMHYTKENRKWKLDLMQ